MGDNTIITTDHPLSEQQRVALENLLDMIIPASDDGRMPSAAELDLVSFIDAELLPVIVETLNVLDDLCAGQTETFASVPMGERLSLVEELSKIRPDLFDRIHSRTLACYYGDDRVLAGLGLETGPPFPRGNVVKQGDLSLLDPVRERAKFYRE